MMILKQLPDKSISKVYSTLVGSVVVTSVIVSGNNTVFNEWNYDNSRHIVRFRDETTNIYKSFTKDDCIILNIPGYSNYKSVDSGVEKVTINEEKLDNLKKLETIALLKDNWNGNGAKAFSNGLITKVRNIVTFLTIQPEVFPTACESLQLEYDKQDGSHMEIELTESEQAEIFFVDNAGQESFFNIRSNVEAINRVVSDFYG